MELKEAISHLDDIIRNKEWDCEECKSEHIQLREYLAELQEYRKAILDCTLIKLPCKVGDERYFISSDGSIEKGTIRDIQIAMTTDYYNEVFYINGVTRQKWIGRGGMYCTREEAEKALKERENGVHSV